MIALDWGSDPRPRRRPFLDPIRYRSCKTRALERWNARALLETTPFTHGKLIVSLTSFAPRFPTAHLTLKCLLTQTLKPDAVVLWIAEPELQALPDTVTSLQSFGLTIRACKDIRSYKKIIPALAQYPDCYIVTADDDIYYGATWLADLAARHVSGRPDVIGYRGHEIRHGMSGKPLPYILWRLNTDTPDSSNLFLTGCGGVLYPPSSLHPDTLDEALFTRLCPTNDDIWLYWMARRAGSAVRKVRGKTRLQSWLGSQTRALAHINILNGANTRQIQAMIRHYGYPPSPDL